MLQSENSNFIHHVNWTWKGSIRRRICGSFSGSWSCTLKLSPKSHQMTIYFIQNDEVFTKTKLFLIDNGFWLRKVVIWWLFNNDLKARVPEPEKKETANFRAYNKTFVIIFEQGYTIWMNETFGLLSHYSTQHFYWLDDDVKSSNLYICLFAQYIYYDSKLLALIVYLATVESGIDIAPWINVAPGNFFAQSKEKNVKKCMGNKLKSKN
jgi:hypothetical protein